MNRASLCAHANDNLNVRPYVIETLQVVDVWWLVMTINGVQSLYTPDEADNIAAQLEGAYGAVPAVNALQYSAYRCRMFNGGMRA